MSGPVNAVRKRIIIFFSIFFVITCVLIGRIAWVQFVDGKRLMERVQDQLKEYKSLQSPRGTVYDRNSHELAVSILAKSLYANSQQFNKDPGEVAKLLAPVLEMDVNELRTRLITGGSFIWLKRTLEPEAAKQVAALIKEHDIRGLEFIEENKRYYPNNSLAAHVLGFVGVDDQGLDGIEMVLDKQLKGTLVRQAVETDNYGVPIFKSIFTFSPPKQGKSVYLTIDKTIQFIVEQSLGKAIARTNAKAATVIVMNTKTGEILAMASYPSYDPNHFYRYGDEDWKNRAVSIIYEPGSTFKSIVAAAALQEGLVRADERFIDNGYVQVSGRRIKNWSGESYGNVSFIDVIKESINTGFVQVGMRLGAGRLNEYTRAFGFGQVTDIELPGEEGGLLFKTSEMRDSDLATMSIGQSIAVTPLQLLTAVSAIANNGVLVKPHIIKEIRNADGTVASATPTEPLRQVISPQVARELTVLLEKVVGEGGGKKAAVKGYRFAGKTGTAEKLKKGGGGYEAGRYIASFVGFGPVEDSQIAALIVIDDPSGVYYGGQIAAPVFSEIMSQIMRYLNIRPQAGFEMAPAVKNNNNPPSAPTVPSGKNAPFGKVVVPTLTNRTIREVGELLSQQGLVFIPVGAGIAVWQSVPPNTVVDAGAEIRVHFELR